MPQWGVATPAIAATAHPEAGGRAMRIGSRAGPGVPRCIGDGLNGAAASSLVKQPCCLLGWETHRKGLRTYLPGLPFTRALPLCVQGTQYVVAMQALSSCSEQCTTAAVWAGGYPHQDATPGRQPQATHRRVMMGFQDSMGAAPLSVQHCTASLLTAPAPALSAVPMRCRALCWPSLSLLA